MAADLQEQAVQVEWKAAKITAAALKGLIEQILANRGKITHGEQSLPRRLGRSSSPHGLALLRRLRWQDVCPPHQQRQAYFSIYLLPIQQSPSWKALHDTAPYQ